VRQRRRHARTASEPVRRGGFFPAPRLAKRFHPPKNFDFENAEDEVLSWLSSAMQSSDASIEEHRRRRKGNRARRPRITSYYDFKEIETMTPAAALVIAALFDRHKQLAGIPIRVYDYEQWLPQVRKVLAQIGFFDLLGVDPSTVLPQDDPSPEAKIERFTSRRQLDPEEAGRLVDTLLGHIFAARPDVSDQDTIARTAKLFEALIEATENTRRHAYPEDLLLASNTVLPNWWLTGFSDPAERRVTLIVYDQGISVPGSLASSRHSDWDGHGWVNRIIKRFSRGSFDPDDPSTDHAKLRLAMKMGRSSTGEPHRGKGLPVVREAIKHCLHGRLHIFSRNGAYLEETGKRALSWQLAYPMPGTLIIWDLQL
jgi:hypothetical protein